MTENYKDELARIESMTSGWTKVDRTTNNTPTPGDQADLDDDWTETAPDVQGSRHPWTNSSNQQNHGLEAALPEIVNDFETQHQNLAQTPLSVRPGTKIREENVWKDNKNRTQASNMVNTLSRFISWAAGYEGRELSFMNQDGDEIRSPMTHSYMEEYGKRYYARLKAVESQVVQHYSNPMTCMLTFSGSNRDEHGNLRPPADHMRDISNGYDGAVYHKLKRTLDDHPDVDDWFYVTILEPHKSSYAHMHQAIFIDGNVEEEDFHGVFDKYLEQCDIAGWEAHNYHSNDPKERPISLNKINPNADPESTNNEIANLGSYISEYIGAFGELEDQPLHTLAFYATAWATQTQRVRFSRDANQACDADECDNHGTDLTLTQDQWGRDTVECQHCGSEFGVPDPEDLPGNTLQRLKNSNQSNNGTSTANAKNAVKQTIKNRNGTQQPDEWRLDAIVVKPDPDDRMPIEERYQPQAGQVEMVAIDGRPDLDKPAQKSSNPPTKQTTF